MAVPAKPEPNQSSEVGLPNPLDNFTELQIHVAKLYGHGVPRAKIARALLDHLAPNKERPVDQRMSHARAKLRRWESSQKFRDLVWDKAVVDLDMAMPGVLNGVTRKARQGRVDAARLVLEITGRHAPKGDGTAPNIVVAINGIPRPNQVTYPEVTADTVDGEAEEIED